MSFDEYFGVKKVNKSELARKIGYTVSHFHKIMSGRGSITKRFASTLEMATEGKLKADEIYQLIKEKEKKRKET